MSQTHEPLKAIDWGKLLEALPKLGAAAEALIKLLIDAFQKKEEEPTTFQSAAPVQCPEHTICHLRALREAQVQALVEACCLECCLCCDDEQPSY